MDFTETERERFWAHVPDGSHDECWLWQGSQFSSGYGRLWAAKRGVRAHRVMWQMVNGPVPDGLFVLHRCDVRRCVNPAHLWLGTHEDNMRDMDDKGRRATGEKSGMRKHPDRYPRGDKSWQRLKPERLATGDRNGSRTHPESRPRSDSHWTRTRPHAVLRGSKASNAILDEGKVREIKRRVAEGEEQSSVARSFGVTKYVVSDIMRGKSWRHVA